MSDTAVVRLSDRSHAILRRLSEQTGKSGVDLLDEAMSLMMEREALEALRKANPANATQALSVIYSALAIRDPSVAAFYDRSEFARVSAWVYRELSRAASGEDASHE